LRKSADKNVVGAIVLTTFAPDKTKINNMAKLVKINGQWVRAEAPDPTQAKVEDNPQVVEKQRIKPKRSGIIGRRFYVVVIAGVVGHQLFRRLEDAAKEIGIRPTTAQRGVRKFRKGEIVAVFVV
jgi:hypothetical protein